MEDAELAIAVATSGAEVVRRRFGLPMRRYAKGAGDFATEADLEAEEAMLALLRRERPEDAIAAEESGRSGDGTATRTWLVDPLCGTRNFAVKTGVVAVNVALCRGEDVLCAAVADPFTREVFWTDGHVARVRDGGRDERLAPGAASGLVDVNLDPPFPSAPGFRAVSLLADPRFGARFRPRVVSSTMALTWVATGQRAGYVTDGDVRGNVHFTAGVALCRAAGCVVSDVHGGPCGTGPTGAIVGADAETHAALLEMARS